MAVQEKYNQVSGENYNIISSSWVKTAAALSGKAYSPNPLAKAELNKLLNKKGLPLDLFDKDGPKFDEDIAAHVKWAFNNIYKIPYSTPLKDSTQIARYVHGIQHVTRTAIYIPVFANLYRRHGDIEAQKLTDEDIKLLQIAAILHDSAREDEGEDRWDHESAILIYMYLTRVLHVDKSKAKLIAEAMANKDSNPKGYFTIQETSDQEISWQWEEPPKQKTIYQELLQCADCIDIIRARDHFQAEYLDFYKKYQNNPLAFEEMAHLITEVRSFIEVQGDTYKHTKKDIKAQYEHEKAYVTSMQAIDPKKHPILVKLTKKLLSLSELKSIELVDLTPYHPELGWTENNIKAAMREGRIFARGIGAPSAFREKPSATGEDEHLAAAEIRKTLRRKGVATQTKKGNSLTKEGNPFRSVSWPGYGSGVISNAGFLILNPDTNDISKISEVDCDSGHGKKKHLLKENLTLSRDQKEKQLLQLHTRLKLGGSSKYNYNHVEILYHIRDYSAIYFSPDPNLYNAASCSRVAEITHPFSPILQALFLRNEYQRATGKELPLVEYSGLHNTMRVVPSEELSEENIKKMWISMCSDFMRTSPKDIYTLSIDDIKTISMYREKVNIVAKKNSPADANYPKHLLEEISTAIELERSRLIKEYEDSTVEAIQSGQLSLCSDHAFYAIKRSPRLAARLSEKIQHELRNIKIDDLDVQSVEEFNTNYFSLDTDILLENKSKDFYRTKTMRMYALAQQCHLTDVSCAVQEHIKSIAMKSIDEICQISIPQARSSYFIRALDTELLKLINFVTGFEIYPHDNIIKEALDDVINQYFQSIDNDFDVKNRLHTDLQQYLLALSKLQSIKMLNSENQRRAQELIVDVKNRVLQTKDMAFFSSFLEAIENFDLSNIDSINIKAFVCQWLDKNFRLAVGNMGLINTLNRFVSLTNDDFFALVVNCLAQNYLPGTQISMLQWHAVVSELRLRLPGSKFNEKQLAKLQSNANELFDKILSSLSGVDNLSVNIKLIEEISSYLKYKKNHIKIPDKAIIELNKRLENYPLTIENFDKEGVNNYKQKLKALLDKLPPEQKQMIEGSLKVQLLNLSGQETLAEEVIPQILL